MLNVTFGKNLRDSYLGKKEGRKKEGEKKSCHARKRLSKSGQKCGPNSKGKKKAMGYSFKRKKSRGEKEQKSGCAQREITHGASPN